MHPRASEGSVCGGSLRSTCFGYAGEPPAIPSLRRREQQKTGRQQRFLPAAAAAGCRQAVGGGAGMVPGGCPHHLRKADT